MKKLKFQYTRALRKLNFDNYERTDFSEEVLFFKFRDTKLAESLKRGDKKPIAIKPKNVPLGTGLVSKDFYKEVQSESFASIPISIHMEYVDHRKPELIDESKRSIASDRRATKRLLQR